MLSERGFFPLVLALRKEAGRSTLRASIQNLSGHSFKDFHPKLINIMYLSRPSTSFLGTGWLWDRFFPWRHNWTGPDFLRHELGCVHFDSFYIRVVFTFSCLERTDFETLTYLCLSCTIITRYSKCYLIGLREKELLDKIVCRKDICPMLPVLTDEPWSPSSAFKKTQPTHRYL